MQNLANTSISLNSETDEICTFFEAKSIGCRKTTCDVTKVTYYTYSCDTCCMSREMMEIEGRKCAKCQKSKRRDTNGINGKFNEENDKIMHSGHLLP